MQSSGGAKNPPWARSNVNTNMSGMNPQIMDPNAMMGQQGMMPFQQGQVFNPNMMQGQGGMAMPMTGQMPMNQMPQGQLYPGNVVAYPTPRALNPGMYQNSNSNQSSNPPEQRVFTGTVTKIHNDFGFVDHDVFYQASVCAKGVVPKLNDRVLVEASYNPNMPFKWNATRVQVLPKGQGGGGPNNQKNNNQKSNNYNAVPPPRDKLPNMRRDDRMNNRRGGGGGGGGGGGRNMQEDRIPHKRSRSRSRSRSRDVGRRDSRARRDSPPRKRPVVHQPSPVKYMVRVPRMPLDVKKMDVPSISQRYNNLYIPSDFFNAHIKWGETFPPQAPFTLNTPANYHIMPKETENPIANSAVFEPPDSDYRFSAKVMLISLPTLESLYQKCGITKVDEKDKRNNKNPMHPTRLIKFLVGQKGKNGENFAIGGPWSPSLDGENPDTDPKVLVKTAIRTCKALTGIDLSACAQWYRMVEFYYWREGSGGKSRLETVVLFLPDVWSAQPSRVDWPTVQEQYKAAHEAALLKLDPPPAPLSSEPATQTAAPAEAETPKPAADKSIIDNENADDSTITIDENDDDVERPEPTHYSKIDLKSIKVTELKQELLARNASIKGPRSALVSRLSKLLKTEQEKDSKSDDVMEVEDEAQEAKKDETEKPDQTTEHIEIKDDVEDEKVDEKKEDKKEEPKKKTEKEIEEEKKKFEREKLALKNRYEIPAQPHLIVHPCTTAKGGKFNASVASLSLLLDYRVTDNKEHSFELFVFAELFNEMLMRDFGFYIYKTLYTIPEKVEEPKEKAEEKAEKKDDKKEDKKEDKKDEKKEDKKDEKKEDKKDEKDVKEIKKDEKDNKKDSRESRRRDRKESHSDDERSSSPKRRSRGVELPPDPYLLLSLVYFDTTRGGYINKKDLQNLFMSLGLQLSRSQIRSIMEKVCVKEQFNYKTLMQNIKDLASGSPEMMQDMPLETTVVTGTELPSHISELENVIASGNRDLLPVFKRGDEDEEDRTASGGTKDVSESGVVMYKNRVIDVGALVAAETRNSSQRARLEAALEAARGALRTARQAAASIQQAERGATSQLTDVSASLAAARARITSLTASSKIFHSALKSIQSKVEAVVNIKYEDDDVVEIVNGPNTSSVSKKEIKKDEIKSEPKDVTPAKEEPKTEVKTEASDDKNEKKEVSDSIATENMDLDDKE